MAIEDGGRTVVRFFTSARRIPLLIGKFPQGGRIPGGPYRLSQLVIGSIVLVAGWNLRPLWGPLVGSPLIQIVALLIATIAAAFAAGRLPSTRRRLSDLALGGLTAATVSSVGSYRGKPVRLQPPHRATGRVALQLTTPPDPDPAPVRETVRATPPTPAPAPTPAPNNVIPINRRAYATGLDRLLEQARREDA